VNEKFVERFPVLGETSNCLTGEAGPGVPADATSVRGDGRISRILVNKIPEGRLKISLI
jgi:hypothetical protein